MQQSLRHRKQESEQQRWRKKREEKKTHRFLLLSSCRHKNVIYFVFNFYLELVSVVCVLESNVHTFIYSVHNSIPFAEHFISIGRCISSMDQAGSFGVCRCISNCRIIIIFIISSHLLYGFEHDLQMNMNARSLNSNFNENVVNLFSVQYQHTCRIADAITTSYIYS